MATLLGRPLRVTFLVSSSVFPLTTSSVWSASLLKKKRLPSGATAAPWFTSMPVISATTLLVTGSMSEMLSPAELVWTIRTVDALPVSCHAISTIPIVVFFIMRLL